MLKGKNPPPKGKVAGSSPAEGTSNYIKIIRLHGKIFSPPIFSRK